MNFATRQKIGTGLYVVAIILLMIHIYQMGAGIENKFFDFAGWVAILVAGIYSAGLAKEKKKAQNDK